MMARKTTIEEVEIHLTRFFSETKKHLMQEAMKTRQPPRRAELMSQLDAFDKVEGRYYHWLTSLGGDK